MSVRETGDVGMNLLIEWFWVGLVLRLRDKYSRWVWVPIAVSPLIVLAALVWLVYSYLDI
jgi:hypothetical protein